MIESGWIRVLYPFDIAETPGLAGAYVGLSSV